METKLKVLVINDHPHPKGSIYTSLQKLGDFLEKENIDTIFVYIGLGPIQGCIGCWHCKKSDLEKCIFNDEVSQCTDLIMEADGIIIGAPVYFGGLNGSLMAFLNRAFFPINKKVGHKLGAAVTVLRRAGETVTLSRLYLYFTNMMMHIVSANYWSQVLGYTSEEVMEDIEAMDTMYNLGKNMAWLLRCIKKAGSNPPPIQNHLLVRKIHFLTPNNLIFEDSETL